jgi:peptidoglycan/LPS O-acetylase OafA/YrhL
MQRYLKAIAAAVAAGAASLVTALDDGTVTGAEGITALVAVLAACGITWAVPNKQAPATTTEP